MSKKTKPAFLLSTKSYAKSIPLAKDLDEKPGFLKNNKIGIAFRARSPDWIGLDYIVEFAGKNPSIPFLVETEAKLTDEQNTEVDKQYTLVDYLEKIGTLANEENGMIKNSNGMPMIRVLYGDIEKWSDNSIYTILDEYEKLCEKYKVVLAIENIPDDTKKLPELHKTLHDNSNRWKHIKRMDDIGNYFPMENNQLKTPEEILSQFEQNMETVGYTHLKQLNSNIREQPLKNVFIDGYFPLKRILKHMQLKTNNGKDVFVLEPSNSDLDLAKHDIDYLSTRRLL